MDLKMLPSLDLQPGDKKTFNINLSVEDIRNYMIISDDTNPIHWNEDYTALTSFRSPILHGTHLLSKLSGVLGTKFPGKGTVVTNITAKFSSPVKYNKTSGASLAVYIEVLGVTNNKASLGFKFAPPGITVENILKSKTVLSGTVDVMNVFDITRRKACQMTKNDDQSSSQVK